MEIEGSKDLPGNSHIASLPPTIDVLQQQVFVSRGCHITFICLIEPCMEATTPYSGPVRPPHPLRPGQHGHGGPSKPSLIKHMLPPVVCGPLCILLARTIQAFKALPWATFTREWETCAMKTNYRLIKLIVIRWYVEFRKIEVACAYTGGQAERSHLV